MNISGLQKFSLLDYPGQPCAVIFTQGCNFRCSYCHNPELLAVKKGTITPQSVLDFLTLRKNQLGAVVITGGEPTLQPDLIPFLGQIKQLDYLIKLDTNGSNPEIIKKIINAKLIDYLAMDIKSSLKNYSQTCGVKVNQVNIQKTISILKNSSINYEFRTTVVDKQLTTQDINEIGQLIHGSPNYFLQKYVSHDASLLVPPSNPALLQFQKIALSYVQNCQIR